MSRLVGGYTDKSGSGYGPALTNSMGCVLGQKGANRLENGYLQITAVSVASRGRNGEKRAKGRPFGAHRIAVFLHHS